MARYSEDKKAQALALLATNEGNVAATRRQLKSEHGWENAPSRKTLTRWQESYEKPAEQQTEPEQAVALKADDVKERLAQDLTGLVSHLVGHVVENERTLAGASLKDISLAIGISVDKLLLLLGQPSEITEERGGGTSIYQQINQQARSEMSGGEGA